MHLDEVALAIGLDVVGDWSLAKGSGGNDSFRALFGQPARLDDAKSFMSFHPMDAHIGGMLRSRHKWLGLTQQTLADHLGVSFRQAQYALDSNRINASMLYKIALRLHCPMALFFTGLEQNATDTAQPRPIADGVVLELA